MSEDDDVKLAIAKLPKAHQKLVKGFQLKFEPNNTLNGDDGHVGVIKTHPKKQIRIASPWNYSKNFVLYHEIGHLVWQTLSKELKEKWSKIVPLNKGRKKDESDEENFSHAFAACYVKHPPTTHYHSAWVKFIKALPNPQPR